MGESILNNFNSQLREGEKAENDFIKIVYQYYPKIIIHKANIDKQRKGYDYIIRDIFFDIKVRDFKYYENRDILLEIISVDNQNTPGWYYTSTADIIVYMFHKINSFYYLYLDNLRDYMNDKIDSYRSNCAKNKRYNTIIKIIPIADIPLNCIEKIDFSKFKLPNRKFIKRLCL